VYSMEYDHKTGILNVRITGFMGSEDSQRFVQELLDEAQKTRRRAGRLRILTVTEGPVYVSPADTIEDWRRLIAALYINPEDRGAYVVDSALGRLHIARMGGEGRLKGFASVEEAMEWLVD